MQRVYGFAVEDSGCQKMRAVGEFSEMQFRRWFCRGRAVEVLQDEVGEVGAGDTTNLAARPRGDDLNGMGVWAVGETALEFMARLKPRTFQAAGECVLRGVVRADSLESAMYEDFVATDRWTGEPQHCVWKATVTAISTRHADATDIRYNVNGRPVWIAMPNDSWVEQKRRNGKVITDYLAAQAVGRYLKQMIETGYDNGREFYTMSIEEVLENVEAVAKEINNRVELLPSLPVVNSDAHPAELDFKLAGEPDTVAGTMGLTAGDNVPKGAVGERVTRP